MPCGEVAVDTCCQSVRAGGFGRGEHQRAQREGSSVATTTQSALTSVPCVDVRCSRPFVLVIDAIRSGHTTGTPSSVKDPCRAARYCAG